MIMKLKMSVYQPSSGRILLRIRTSAFPGGFSSVLTDCGGRFVCSLELENKNAGVSAAGKKYLFMQLDIVRHEIWRQSKISRRKLG